MPSTTIQNMFASHFPVLDSWLPAEYLCLRRYFANSSKWKVKRNVGPHMLELRWNLCGQVSGEVQVLCVPDWHLSHPHPQATT